MRRPERLIPLLIAVLFLSPVLAAWLAQTAWHPRLLNYGELVQPQAVSFGRLTDAGGWTSDLDALHGKWLLVTVAGGGCDSACRQNVFLARQVQIAQGGNRSRLERVLISDRITVAPFDAELHRYASSRISLRRLARESSSRTYLVDPLGRAVLRYPEQPDGKAMIRDVHRLLQASHIG